MSDATHAADRNRASQPQPSRLARIAQRAHEIYDARGGQDGKDLDDWLQAEREIDAEIDAAGSKGSMSLARISDAFYFARHVCR